MLTRHLTSSPKSLPSFALRVVPILVITLGTCLSMSKPLPAQSVGGEWTTFYQFKGPEAREEMGHSVSEAGDVNGDGYPDVIFGVFGFRAGNKAYVHSGFDGSLLWELFPEPSFSGDFGRSVAGAGDVNADGFHDLIVGAPSSDSRNGTFNTGSAYVFSGLDASLLYRFDGATGSDLFGYSISAAGDVDLDGYADVIVGAVGAGLTIAGSAIVYSGLDGSIIFQFDGHEAWSSFGQTVAESGDMNSDFFPDLVVGAPGSDGGGIADAGSTFVYSGFDGSELHQFHGPGPDYLLGTDLAEAGDVNQDGTPDLIIGAGGNGPNGGYSGSAFVYSGIDGALLFEFFGAMPFDLFGSSVDGAGDVDRDGYPDFIIGASRVDAPGGLLEAGSVFVYSGRDGSLLHTLVGKEQYANLGSSVAGIGDVDGDGFPELLAGAPRADPGGRAKAGSVFLFGIDPFLTTDADTLSATNGVHVNLSLDFPATEGGFYYALLLSATGTGPTSLNGVDIPLTADAMFNRMLTGWAPPVIPNAFGKLDFKGDAMVLAVSNPRLTPYVGQAYYAAAVSFDPVGLVPRLSSVVRSVVIVP